MVSLNGLYFRRPKRRQLQDPLLRLHSQSVTSSGVVRLRGFVKTGGLRLLMHKQLISESAFRGFLGFQLTALS